MIDHPFDEVTERAAELIRNGSTVFQKFTCANCKVRQTIPVPNVFYIYGTCEECGHTTNIQEQGCNYMLITALTT